MIILFESTVVSDVGYILLAHTFARCYCCCWCVGASRCQLVEEKSYFLSRAVEVVELVHSPGFEKLAAPCQNHVPFQGIADKK